MEDVLLRPLLGLATGVVLADGEFEVARLETPFVVELSFTCFRFPGCDCVGSDLRGFAAILHVLRLLPMVLTRNVVAPGVQIRTVCICENIRLLPLHSLHFRCSLIVRSRSGGVIATVTFPRTEYSY
jgi:hypothetical protein